jgi:hypothetical protein
MRIFAPRQDSNWCLSPVAGRFAKPFLQPHIIQPQRLRAKFYELTRSGRSQLEVERDAWVKLTAAMAQVLGTAQEIPAC